METILGKLKKADYLQWRVHIAEWQKSQKDLELYVEKGKVLESQLENLKLKIALHKKNLNAKQNNVNEFKSEYENYRTHLENKLKIKLVNCVIDDITLEIKKIEE